MFEGQKAAGWLPKDATLTARSDNLAGWDSIPKDERAFQACLMEVFAGFAEYADTQAGLLIDELEKTSKLDNTLIFYVWRDNASSDEGQNGTRTEVNDHIRGWDDDLGGLAALGGSEYDNKYYVIYIEYLGYVGGCVRLWTDRGSERNRLRVW